MKILVVSNTPLNPRHGSGYVVCGYVDRLRERGHIVDAFGPEHFASPRVRRGGRYLHPLMMARFGVRQVRRSGYDVVECYGAASWLLMWRLRQWVDRPFALAHHSNGIESHVDAVRREAAAAGLIAGRRWFQVDLSRINEIGLRSADAIVTVSDYDAAFVRSRGFITPDRVYAIPNALPDGFLGLEFSYQRQRRIGYCGSWIDRKGRAVMLRDVSMFLREAPDWSFSLVGVGTDADVRDQFPADVRSRVEVIPFVERSDLPEWYRSLAALIVPSIYESFGLVQAEAMACGTPIIATPVGFAASLRDREEVFLIPAARSPELYDALLILMRDEPLRQRIARGGYERVQHLRWETALAAVEKVYGSVVNR